MRFLMNLNAPQWKGASFLLCVGCAVMVLGLPTAEAQRIHRFDDQGEDRQAATQPTEPAAPVAAPTQGDGEETDAPVGSYHISIHGQAGTQQGLRELLATPRIQLYQGIIPGERDEVAGFFDPDHLAPDDNVVTWVGFDARPDKTRVFVQTVHPVNPRLEAGDEPNTVRIVLPNTGITKSNFERFIDTSYFGRTVERIETTETGAGDVELRLTLVEPMRPALSTDGEYLRIDFDEDDPAVAYRTPETAPQAGAPQATAGAPQAAGVKRSDPDGTMVALDESPQAEEHRHAPPDPVEEPIAERPEEPPIEEPEESAVDDPGEVDPPEIAEEVEPSSQRRWGLATGVSGLLLMGAGGGFGLAARSHRSVVTDVPMDEVVPVTQQRAAEIEQTANRLDTTGLILAIAGGVALAAGTTLWLTAPDNSSSTAEAHFWTPRVDVRRESTVLGVMWNF